jgi:hypothetical protein
MPKILINELDKTTPGTPAGYSNYSVLIAGFMGRTPVLENVYGEDGKTVVTKADKVLPDTNGVYEFSSAQDFIDTIGLVAAGYTDGELQSITNYHYGNQMAYELLNLGYSIIYLPINPANCVATLNNANTWEIFKDKASYDFRFITHGLLEASDTTNLDSRITDLDDACSALFNTSVIDIDINQTADPDPADITVDDAAYSSLLEKLSKGELSIPGLLNTEGKYYATGAEAVAGLIAEKQDKNALKRLCITDTVINDVNGHIANLAMFTADGTSGRGDCIALIELDEKAYASVSANPESAIIAALNNMSVINDTNGKYCAMTVPSVVYNMTVNDAFKGNKKFPGAFHYLACFMSSLKTGFAEWYAAAGYTRGVSSYKIDRTTVTLGEIAINALEPRNTDGTEGSPNFACNVIANFRGSYYLWGNRTAHKLSEAKGGGDLVASHFLNIRQLCTTIKKQLYVACRRFTFDPNSDTLWFNFVSAIRPTLEAMKADQGIRDYKILKVYTDKKATLKAKIRIIPIEAVEDFDIEVRLEDSFGETAVIV